MFLQYQIQNYCEFLIHSFIFTVSGTPEPVIKWFRNGHELTGTGKWGRRWTCTWDRTRIRSAGTPHTPNANRKGCVGACRQSCRCVHMWDSPTVHTASLGLRRWRMRRKRWRKSGARTGWRWRRPSCSGTGGSRCRMCWSCTGQDNLLLGGGRGQEETLGVCVGPRCYRWPPWPGRHMPGWRSPLPRLLRPRPRGEVGHSEAGSRGPNTPEGTSPTGWSWRCP